MLSLLFMAAQAATAAAAPVQCEIIAEKEEAGYLLVGACGESGVMLGRVSSYESHLNGATGAAVALVERLGSRQALLVRSDPDGHAVLDIITSDLAQQVGRARDAGLSGLTIDMTSFASAGLIRVEDSKGSTSSSNRSKAFSVAQLVADAVLERTLPKEPSRVVEVPVPAKDTLAQ